MVINNSYRDFFGFIVVFIGGRLFIYTRCIVVCCVSRGSKVFCLRDDYGVII